MRSKLRSLAITGVTAMALLGIGAGPAQADNTTLNISEYSVCTIDDSWTEVECITKDGRRIIFRAKPGHHFVWSRDRKTIHEIDKYEPHPLDSKDPCPPETVA